MQHVLQGHKLIPDNEIIQNAIIKCKNYINTVYYYINCNVPIVCQTATTLIIANFIQGTTDTATF